MLAPPEKPIPLSSEGHSRAAWAIALVLIAALALVVLGVGRRADRGPAVRSYGRAAVPAGPLPAGLPPPPVEPTLYADMTPEQARADNDARRFDTARIAPAARFVFTGSPADRVAARACLAAALLYEAGDDRVGEQAVAQVVLNRLRHPAFPKTVCGVVFQGSERPTGCQFTFTCDGSLARAPSAPAWERATKVADAALSGTVDKDVGTATHYHADWVVPYWRDSLTKLAKVHTHIFYRWAGWWGTPRAFAGRPQPFERIDPRIVALAGPGLVLPSDPAALPPEPAAGMPARAAAPRALQTIDGVPARALKGAKVWLKNEAAGQFVVQLDAGDPARWAVTGFTICGGRADCIVSGWTSEAAVPQELPVPPIALRTAAFLYRKSSVDGSARALWDCRRYPRPTAAQCIPGTERLRDPPPPSRRAASLPAAALRPPVDPDPPPAGAARPPLAPASH